LNCSIEFLTFLSVLIFYFIRARFIDITKYDAGNFCLRKGCEAPTEV